MTLHYLRKSPTHDLFEIKKLANKIIENEDAEKISLTDYYTLKTIFYAK